MVGRHGIAAETNPLVAHAFVGFGLPLLALMKVALVVLVASTVVILDRARRSRRSVVDLAAAVTVVAVIGGLVAGITNVLAT